MSCERRVQGLQRCAVDEWCKDEALFPSLLKGVLTMQGKDKKKEKVENHCSGELEVFITVVLSNQIWCLIFTQQFSG